MSVKANIKVVPKTTTAKSSSKVPPKSKAKQAKTAKATTITASKTIENPIVPATTLSTKSKSTQANKITTQQKKKLECSTKSTKNPHVDKVEGVEVEKIIGAGSKEEEVPILTKVQAREEKEDP